MDLRRGIQEACDHVVGQLVTMSKSISSEEEINQVATISANSDTELGSLIATAFGRVGKDGVITVQDGKTLQDELDVVEGVRFDRGYISPYFVTNNKSQKVEFSDPLILFFDSKISSLNALLPLLEQIMKDARPLLIVAEDVEGEALATLVVNKLRGGLKIAAVKAPGFGENRKANLQDLAILTGGQVISEEVGLKLESVTLDMLGTCKEVTITKDDTVVLHGKGDKDSVAERVELLKDAIEDSSSEYEKEKLQERLAKITGGIAVIKVGGASEVEVGEKKDRVEDALNATRAAVSEGIVVGGGCALLHASKSLAALKEGAPNMDHKIGVEILERALRVPAFTIASNAGEEGAVVVGELLKEADKSMGFNAATGKYTNLVDEGIIDPTLVVKTALVDAASVGGLLLTSEAAIVTIKEPAGAAPDPMGGMGGMGGGMPGMGF